MTPFHQSSTQPATPDPGKRHQRMLVAVLVACITAATWLSAQQGTLTPGEQQRRHDLEDELQSIATVEPPKYEVAPPLGDTAGRADGLIFGLAVLALTLTAVNMFGGFAVTRRMLAMFRK